MKAMILAAMLFTTGQIYSATYNNTDFEKIEELVFKPEEASEVRKLLVADDGIGLFQNALVYYRLGNLETNFDMTKKSVSMLEKCVQIYNNVYTICYLGMAYGVFTAKTPNPVEKLDYLDKTKKTLESAVSNYPSHYLPRLYRGSMNLMIPEIVGGNVESGIKDLEMVIQMMPQIKRDNNFKSFVYFLYGSVIADKKNDKARGIENIKKAQTLADNDKMKEAIQKKMEELQK